MEIPSWCPCCRLREYDCKCTPQQLDRHHKLEQLRRARDEVAHLEAELGVISGSNRKQRRASIALARKRA